MKESDSARCEEEKRAAQAPVHCISALAIGLESLPFPHASLRTTRRPRPTADGRTGSSAVRSLQRQPCCTSIGGPSGRLRRSGAVAGIKRQSNHVRRQTRRHGSKQHLDEKMVGKHGLLQPMAACRSFVLMGAYDMVWVTRKDPARSKWLDKRCLRRSHGPPELTLTNRV
jgi:hypothetical protein